MTVEVDYRCSVCGYGRLLHDPETGRMPSDVTGCACGDGPTCQTTGGPASQCRGTKHHVYNPDPEWGRADYANPDGPGIFDDGDYEGRFGPVILHGDV